MKKAISLLICLSLFILLVPAIPPAAAHSANIMGDKIPSVVVTFDPGDFGYLPETVFEYPNGSQIGVLPVPVNTTFKSDSFNSQYILSAGTQTVSLSTKGTS